MKLEHYILGLLCFKPYTGYDIKKYFDTEGRFSREPIHFSQLYRTLKSMQEQGWTTFVEEEREGRPDTKTYSLTAAGKVEFFKWLDSPLKPSFRFQESELTARLHFAALLSKKTILHFLRVELEFRQAQIAQYRNRNRHADVPTFNKDINQQRYIYFADILHENGAASADLYVDWIKRTIARVEKDLPDDEQPLNAEHPLATTFSSS
jgi:PadR family transcriptional regulator AphA